MAKMTLCTHREQDFCRSDRFAVSADNVCMARRARMTHRVTERWLREELITLRDKNDWTRGYLARVTGMHPRTIERIENGPEPISTKSLAALMYVYGLGKAAKDRLRDMQELAYAVGWWDEWHDVELSRSYAEHCELEHLADKIDMFAPTIFHGLVQSPEYAEYIQTMSRPALRSGPRADRFIQLRLERQQRCWAKRRKVRVLIDAVVLSGWERGPVRQQVAYLIDLERQGALEVKALPLNEALIVPDIFTVFTVGKRKSVCLGGLVEHHTEAPITITDAQDLFDQAWGQSVPLATLGDKEPWTFAT